MPSGLEVAVCCSTAHTQFATPMFDASSFLLSRRPVPLFLIHIDRSASQNSSFTLFPRKILASRILGLASEERSFCCPSATTRKNKWPQ